MNLGSCRRKRTLAYRLLQIGLVGNLVEQSAAFADEPDLVFTDYFKSD